MSFTNQVRASIQRVRFDSEQDHLAHALDQWLSAYRRGNKKQQEWAMGSIRAIVHELQQHKTQFPKEEK